MSAPKRLFIKTYGCQMNVYDSERMADVLSPLGYVAVDEPQGADLVVLGAEGANGLEFDATVVVEPGEIARRGAGAGESVTPRGLRTLYVAMTRPTRRLAIVASSELPETLR
jgi:superfamily I DNA/RNA helicase